MSQERLPNITREGHLKNSWFLDSEAALQRRQSAGIVLLLEVCVSQGPMK